MILHNESIDAYHAHPAVSASKISTYLRHGPGRYHRQYVEKSWTPKETEAFRFGRMFDDLLGIDSADFVARYIVQPRTIDRRKTTDPKVREFLDASLGKAIINQDEWDMMEAMRAAVRANPIAMALLCDAQTQVTARQDRTDCGGEVQCRPDFVRVAPTAGVCDGSAIIDLKTTDSLNGFDWSFEDYGYHRQAALASVLLAADGIQATPFLLVVEKQMPAPRCEVVRIEDRALSDGWEVVQQAATDIHRRMQSGDWQSRQTGIRDITLRRYRAA